MLQSILVQKTSAAKPDHGLALGLSISPLDTACTDNDGDGYAIEGGDCGPVDCNDYRAYINPGAAEKCDDRRNRDENCNGLANGQDPVCNVSDCTDNDGDGFGVGEDCNTAKDCNDNDAYIFPGQKEVSYNSLDDNCNGKVDENNDTAGADGATLYARLYPLSQCTAQ